MGGPLFQSRGHRSIMSPEERKASSRHANVIAAIRRFCKRKVDAHIEPARATWLELQAALSEDEMNYLEHLVKCGVVSKWDSIRFHTYAINSAELNKYEQELRRFAQM